ncbi:hypothetical protein [Streptomyces sp. NBC_00140]|uniref:hypothetical protein n=1 Tax=Streptomyces sp. NBC_00140 TaxID=2975664 RepID=UPI00225A0B68|nr:hypothetical protein [Streptomyces sp. NBC_00140]MCX5333335.1 hypothetical protein [Streptomyces sp. NBC_00140]
MGWGDIRRELGRARRAGDTVAVNAAAAVGAAQLPAAVLIAYVDVSTGDDYGGSGAAFGLVCLLLLAPLWLPFVGLLHACVQTLPAAVLARLTVRRVHGPEWAWHLAWAAVLGVVWAGAVALPSGLPFAATAAVFVALGILPVLGVTYFRRSGRSRERAWGCAGTWILSASVSFVLFMVVFGGAVLATETGIVKEYEPPKLSAGQLAGVWRGEDGAVLRLHAGGRAELTALPTVSENDDWFADPPYTVCEGTGAWEPVRGDEGEDADRDGVGLRVDGGCGSPTLWTIGGTEREPELFVLFGDPDAGDLRILTRD